MADLLLAVDTSTPGGSIALCDGEEVLFECYRKLPGTHTDWLLPAIEQLFNDAGIGLHDLALLAVVHGPGSFTGLRVGMATVKGLAIGGDLPVAGISSLELLASSLPHARMPVCALLDARKKEVYAGLFDTHTGRPEILGRELVIDPEQLLDSLSGDILFIGDGADVYRTLIVRQLGSRAHFAGASCSAPRASRAAALALAMRDAGQLQPLAGLSPCYIRASEAEVNWARQQSQR